MGPPRSRTSESKANPEWEQILAQMSELALTADKRAGQTPPKVNPAQIRAMHAQAFASSKVERPVPAGSLATRQTFCGDIFVSKKSIHQLKRIGIKDMKMEMMHEGKYLLVRIIEPCFKMSGIMTVVEDPEGSVSILSLYNFITSDKTDVEALLPVGTILAIKEPYYKFSNTNSCVIRCDAPSDIILLGGLGLENGLDEENLCLAERLLAGVTWSTKNNVSIPGKNKKPLAEASNEELASLLMEVFPNKKYRGVVEIASHLILQGSRLPQLYQIRGSAYLGTGQLEKAFTDFARYLETNPTDSSGTIFTAQTLYALRRFADAEKMFMMAFSLPDVPLDVVEMKVWLDRCKKRLAEEREGKYELAAMMTEASHSVAPRLENADYIGPIRLVPTGSSYKVVVTKAVEPGTLLMACKAFEIVYQSELKDAASAFMLVNFRNSIISFPAQSQLVTKMALSLMNNPSMALGLYSMDVRDSASKDPSDLKLYADDVNQREPIANVGLLHRIVAHNALNPEPLDETMLGFHRRSKANKDDPPDAGIWILPSHIKHACCPSAAAVFIGDFMFVRAKHQMKPGDEVTVSTIESVAPLADRNSELASRNCSCYCSLCEAERAEPKGLAAKRASILDTFSKTFKLGQPNDLAIITKTIDGLKETYKNFPLAIKQLLYLPYTALGAVYLSRDDRRKAAESFELALRSLGFTQAHQDYLLHSRGVFPRDLLLPLAPMTAVHVYNYYWHAGEYDLAEKWYRIAKGLDRILHGGEEAVFKRLYHSFLTVV